MAGRHLSAVPDDQAIPPTKVRVQWPKSIEPAHRNDLEKSGLTPLLVRQRGYRSIDVVDELEYLDFIPAQQRLGLLIPVRWQGEVVGHQLKPNRPRLLEGKKIKYENPMGRRIRLDCHPRMQAKLQDVDEPLAVTEGIKKGDAAARVGLPCIALVGVDGWAQKVEGVSKPLEDWDDVPLQGRNVYVIFDSDTARNESVQGARRRLSEFLASRGAEVWWVTLPDGDPDDDLFYDGSPIKQGLDDYLAGGHTLDEMLALAKPAVDQTIRAKAHERYVFHRGDEIARQRILDESSDQAPFKLWTVPDLLAEESVFEWAAYDLLSKGSYGITAGMFKTLKTLVSTFVNVGLASGVAIFDRFTVPQPMPVLNCVGEGGRFPFRRRLERVARAMGVDLDGLPLKLVFDVAPIGSPRFMDSLRRDLDEMGPGHVCLDPLYAYHSADVDPRNLYQRGAMLTSLSQPCVDAGSSLLVVDHFNQTGSGAGLGRVSQAGVQEWADTWQLLSHRSPPDVPAGEFRLLLETGSRIWGGARWDLDLSLGSFDSDKGDHVGEIEWELRPHEHNDQDSMDQQLGELLLNNPYKYTRKQIEEHIGGNHDQFRVIWAQRVAAGQIVSDHLKRQEGNRSVTRELWALGRNPAQGEAGLGTVEPNDA